MDTTDCIILTILTAIVIVATVDARKRRRTQLPPRRRHEWTPSRYRCYLRFGDDVYYQQTIDNVKFESRN